MYFVQMVLFTCQCSVFKKVEIGSQCFMKALIIMISQGSFVQENDQQFLFTYFQPYAANRVFPCFDQPSLKAKIKLTVIGTEKWRILSNQKQLTSKLFISNYHQQNQKIKFGKHPKDLIQLFVSKVKGQNTTITQFPFTKLIPIYTFFVGAGNYLQKAISKDFLPLSIFYTTSTAKLILKYADFILDVTIKCMDFFQTYFGVKYPFNKFDQIFVKDFNTVAMQNAGIVAFNYDKMIPYQQCTQYELYYLAVIISHQLSHQWFGDLVSIKWWNDLWLKQSFAQYLSTYSLEILKNKFTFQGKQLFQSSYAYLRQHTTDGYDEDHRSNATHSIIGQVNNTDLADSLFDGITYQKSQAIMKQLFNLVGHEKMSVVFKNYFQKFSWDNATTDDLFNDLNAYFPNNLIDIYQWKKMWLQTPSLNVFQCFWDPLDTSTSSKLVIKQQVFSGLYTNLRFHQIKVGIFNQNAQLIDFPTQIIIKDSSTEMTIDGSKKISAILVNYDGNTFVQNVIDSVSLIFFMKNIDKIKDLLTRVCIWLNISSMVKLSLVNVQDFVIFVKQKLFLQPFNLMISRILSILLKYLAYLSQEQQLSYKTQIFNQIYRQLFITSDQQTQKIQILQDALVQYAQGNIQMTILKNWFYGKDPLSSTRVMNIKQMWQIIKKLYAWKELSLPDKEQAFQYASKKDSSSRSSQIKITCDAIIANKTQFQSIYQEFLSSKTSINTKRLKAQGWNNDCHQQILAQYKQIYFQNMIKLSTQLSYAHFYFYYHELQPIDSDSSNNLKHYQKVIIQLLNQGGQQQHIKNITKITDDLKMKLQGTLANADTNSALAQRRAILRCDYIQKQSIKYDFHICFEQKLNYYKGYAQIRFNLKLTPYQLPLDFITEEIYGITVNNYICRSARNGEFLLLSGQYLAIGLNVIRINYRNKYNNDGLGCMSYLQTFYQPSKQYIYTKFQPYGAHRFVPCFDQPDLKAQANFYVILPGSNNWKAIGNQPIITNLPYSKDQYRSYYTDTNKILFQQYISTIQSTVDRPLRFNIFKKTQLLPTYLYCLVVGEYYQIKLPQQKQVRNNIPMNLYCIQSYSKNMDNLADFIFQMTILSLLFYQQKFGVNYPFFKYDSVFCHQFKSGAMQNPGVITFNDTYLYPQQVSIQKMLNFASTIVHQNSHNWFGNYVTMKWWDDLWLNQSFADLMAYYCLQNIKDKVTTIGSYDGGWKPFLVRGVLGYREDQITQTTHAVRSQVANTSVAQTYFDRITYQKGSATLKQLLFLMGQDNFFKGVHDYFMEFYWNNGTIDDFLSKMQTHFDPEIGFTLMNWKESWLLNPSLNIISIDWDPQNLNSNAQIKIKQQYYSQTYQFLRYHKTKVAFFKQDLSYDVKQFLIIPQQINILRYDGSNKYKAILMNAQYWSYYKYKIDTISEIFFKANINQIPDALTRIIIWHDLNQSVRDGNSKLQPFVQYLLGHIFDEADDKIFQFQLAFLSQACSYVNRNMRKDIKIAIFDKIYQNIKSLGAVGDLNNRIILLKDLLTIFATNQTQIAKMKQWFENANQDLIKYPRTFSQAWEVVKLIYASQQYSYQIKLDAYTKQNAQNPGIKAQLTKNTCDMLIADDNLMESTYNGFKQVTMSLDAKRSFADGWNHPVHLDLLTQKYKPKYFSDIITLSKTLISNHFQFFYDILKPIDDNLQDTIIEYENIQLVGDNMIGHRKKLAQIKYNYQLRLKLYNFNS